MVVNVEVIAVVVVIFALVCCVYLCSLGGTASPRVWGLEGKAPQESFVGLEPCMGFCTKSYFGHFHGHISTCDGMR